jgi:hypothetical protein
MYSPFELSQNFKYFNLPAGLTFPPPSHLSHLSVLNPLPQALLIEPVPSQEGQSICSKLTLDLIAFL